jgi:dihydroflavonol-4-reductase
MYETHVALTRLLLDAAKKAGVKRFVHVSSIVTLGHSILLRNEDSIYNAQALGLAYWKTKLEAEQAALAANAPGFEVVVVNPGTLLGVGERSGQLTPFVKKLARATRPFLPNGGSDFLDVEDGASGCVLALKKGRAGERYILGSENLTYAQLHKRLRTLNQQESRPILVPKWLLSIVTFILKFFEAILRIDLPINAARLTRVNGVFMFHDLAKSKRELDYQPHPIDEALRHMLKE